MSAWLPSLPFDVLFEISTNLNLDDVIHLSLTCHQLRAIILNDTLAFQVVEASDNDLTRTYIPDKCHRETMHIPTKLDKHAAVR